VIDWVGERPVLVSWWPLCVWSQPAGEAHPDTLALDEDARAAGVSADDVIVVVEYGGETAGYRLEDVRGAGGFQ
jgi:hypothetical protein